MAGRPGRRWPTPPGSARVSAELARPARPEHGDYSTNLALGLAGKLQMPPRTLAERVIQALPETDWVAKVEVAGPGFINFFLTHAWLQDTIIAIATQRENFGRQSLGEDLAVQVEFVSA